MWDNLKAIGHWIDAIVDFFFLLFYFLFRAISYIVSFVEALFRRLAGLDSMNINGVEVGGSSGTDLVYGLILNKSVQNLFWSILGFSIILLVILTIIALVKSEFTLDLKASAKGPIIGRALKALINFFLVPIFTIIAILGVNMLTQALGELFIGNNGGGIVAKCFLVGAHNANRLRLNDSESTQFYEYLHSGNFLWYNKDNTNKDNTGSNSAQGENPFKDFATAEEMAKFIDECFTSDTHSEESSTQGSTGLINPIYSVDYRELDDASAFYDYLDDGHSYAPWHTLMWGYPTKPSNSGNLPMYDTTAFNYYYNPREFDFILAIGTAVIISWNLLTVCLALLKRAFELVILFVLSPAMISIAPLDNGNALDSWRKEVSKRALAIIGPLFAYNIFFMFVDVLGDVEIFTVTTEGVLSFAQSGLIAVFNIFFQLIVLIVALGLLKTASQMISSLLGIEDLVASGGQIAGKAVSTATKTAMVATGAGAIVGGTLFKGAAAGLKGLARTGKHVKDWNAYRQLKNQSVENDEYKQAKAERDRYNAELRDANQMGYIDMSSEEWNETIRKRNEAQARMDAARQKIKSGDLTSKDVVKKTKDLRNWLSNEAQSSSSEIDPEDLDYIEEQKLKELDKESAMYSHRVKEALAKKNQSKGAFRRSITEEFGSDKKKSVLSKTSKKLKDKVEKSSEEGILSKVAPARFAAEKLASGFGTFSNVLNAGLRDNYSRIYSGISGVVGGDSAAGQVMGMLFTGSGRKALWQSEREKKRADDSKSESDAKKAAKADEQARAEYRKESGDSEQQRAYQEEKVNMINAAKLHVASTEGFKDEYNELMKNFAKANLEGNKKEIKNAKDKLETFEIENRVNEKAQRVVASLDQEGGEKLFEQLQKIYATQLMEANKKAFSEAGVKLKEGTKVDANINFDRLERAIITTLSGKLDTLSRNMQQVVEGIGSLKEVLKPPENNN